MFSGRDLVVFLAGAAFFHTLSHIFLGVVMPLPLDMKIMVLTPNMNMLAIVGNAVVTLLLLILAYKLGKK